MSKTIALRWPSQSIIDNYCFNNCWLLTKSEKNYIHFLFDMVK